MRAAKNGGLTILFATVLCREGKLHRAEQAIGAEVTLYLRSRQSVFDQVASKALSTGWLHAWSVLLPPNQSHAAPLPSVDQLPVDCDLAVRGAESTVLGGICRQLVDQKPKRRSRLARQGDRWAF